MYDYAVATLLNGLYHSNITCFRCCNDIVLEMVANKAKETENNSGDNEYKDLKRLEV